MGKNTTPTKKTRQRAIYSTCKSMNEPAKQCGQCKQFRECSIYAGVRANGHPCANYDPK